MPVPRPVPKAIGSDTELANFILDERDSAPLDQQRAAQVALAAIDGVPQFGALTNGYGGSYGAYGYSQPTGSASTVNPQDRGRKFLTNGGCAYIDLNHLELCTPLVRSAFDFVAAFHAMLRIAQDAMFRVNECERERLALLANNSDGRDHSYGGHINLLLHRQTWENIFHRRLQHLLYLASHQASSIVFTGAGKVGAENGRPPARFQLSQRADFMETMMGEQTTFRRPVVNSRDESLCGDRFVSSTVGAPVSSSGYARLHVIFYDTNLQETANLLKTGALQLILAALEHNRINANLLLDDPLRAVVQWSHDPTLRHTERLIDGRQVTAIDHQSMLLDEISRCYEEELWDDAIVPHGQEILATWAETLDLLRARDMGALAARLDWPLKLALLLDAMAENDLTWLSPEMRHLDLVYHSLDPEDGLYLACAGAGFVQRVVDDQDIDDFMASPPQDTRAWTRAILLQRYRDFVSRVDWDEVCLRLTDGRHWPRMRTLSLADPLSMGRAEAEPVLNAAATLEEALDILDPPGAEWSSAAASAIKPLDGAAVVAGVQQVGGHVNHDGALPVRVNSSTSTVKPSKQGGDLNHGA